MYRLAGTVYMYIRSYVVCTIVFAGDVLFARSGMSCWYGSGKPYVYMLYP